MKKDLSILNEMLMSHVMGGASGEEFTCVADSHTHTTRGAVDDTDTGEIIRYLDGE